MITRKNKKFTIIELLVVIAIISILAALLLPSLKNAKKSAYAIVNVNKLKSIATATVLYINKHNTYPNISDLRNGYIEESELLDSNNQLFVMEQGITVDSNFTDRVIIDTSISGYTNTLYADGHVTTERN